jgi:dynactin 1
MADTFSSGQVITLLDGRQATIRFVGLTHFAQGDWIGIELDEPTGKNDGAVQGERYFYCEHGFGMFIRPSAIAGIVEQPRGDSKQLSKTGGNTTGRPQSTQILGSAIKRQSVLSSTAKRQSINAVSPSPAPRVATSQPALRVWYHCLRRSGHFYLAYFSATVSNKISDEAFIWPYSTIHYHKSTA